MGVQGASSLSSHNSSGLHFPTCVPVKRVITFPRVLNNLTLWISLSSRADPHWFISSGARGVGGDLRGKMKVAKEEIHPVQELLYKINSDFSSETMEIEDNTMIQSEERKPANQETYMQQNYATKIKEKKNIPI